MQAGSTVTPVSWNPTVQVNSAVVQLARHARVNTNGHVPSAIHAWMSGGGNVSKLVKGEATNNAGARHTARVRDVIFGSGWRKYSAAYHGWIAAGRPTSTATVPSGEGQVYTVQVADATPPRTPLDSPWDDRLVWRGRSRPFPSTSAFQAGAARAGDIGRKVGSSALLLINAMAIVVTVVAFYGLVRPSR